MEPLPIVIMIIQKLMLILIIIKEPLSKKECFGLMFWHLEAMILELILIDDLAGILGMKQEMLPGRKEKAMVDLVWWKI